MKVQLVQCEACDKTHPFKPGNGPVSSQLPASWITLVHSDQTDDDLHYCSRECLAASLEVQPQEQPTEKPASKMRRFLLVDGDTADEFEGVQFSSEWVSVDLGERDAPPLNFADWEHFKKTHQGCGITWIDQEVSDAS